MKCYSCDDTKNKDECAYHFAYPSHPADCKNEDICVRATATDQATGKELRQLKCAYYSEEETKELLGQCLTSGPIVERRVEDFNYNMGHTAQLGKMTVCGCNHRDGCNGASGIGVLPLMLVVALGMVPALVKALLLHGDACT